MWRSEQDGISAIKFEIAQLHFFKWRFRNRRRRRCRYRSSLLTINSYFHSKLWLSMGQLPSSTSIDLYHVREHFLFVNGPIYIISGHGLHAWAITQKYLYLSLSVLTLHKHGIWWADLNVAVLVRARTVLVSFAAVLRLATQPSPWFVGRSVAWRASKRLRRRLDKYSLPRSLSFVSFKPNAPGYVTTQRTGL